MRRRQFLATTGIAAVTTLAGCSGEEGGEGGGGGDGNGSEDNGSSESSNDSANDSAGSNESGENESGSGGADSDEVLTDEDQESAVEGLEILEHELVEGDFGATVEGVVLNDTGSELGYVEVGVVLYNAEGQRINDSFTNTSDLPTGEEWAFEIMLTEDTSEIEEYTIAVTDSPF